MGSVPSVRIRVLISCGVLVTGVILAVCIWFVNANLPQACWSRDYAIPRYLEWNDALLQRLDRHGFVAANGNDLGSKWTFENNEFKKRHSTAETTVVRVESFPLWGKCERVFLMNESDFASFDVKVKIDDFVKELGELDLDFTGRAKELFLETYANGGFDPELFDSEIIDSYWRIEYPLIPGSIELLIAGQGEVKIDVNAETTILTLEYLWFLHFPRQKTSETPGSPVND